MALVVGGYLSRQRWPPPWAAATAIRRHAPILAVVAAIGALVTYLLAGPLLGGIPSGHFLELWGIFTLLMLAVAFAAAALADPVRDDRDADRDRRLRCLRRQPPAGSVARPFLPSFWGTIGLHSFPGRERQPFETRSTSTATGSGSRCIVLAAYLVAGAVVAVRIRRRTPPSRSTRTPTSRRPAAPRRSSSERRGSAGRVRSPEHSRPQGSLGVAGGEAAAGTLSIAGLRSAGWDSNQDT